MLPEDVRALALDVLRHRLVLTYEALAEGVDADALLERVIAAVPVPRSDPVAERGCVSRHLAVAGVRRAATVAQAPAAVIKGLDLTVRRRIDRLVAGEHRSPALGHGTEIAQVRPYQFGDDVRQMDWAVTARTREPHVRVHVAERTLTTWLLLDTSASMSFGTADRRKADVAEGAALAVGHLATRQGNRLGVMTFGAREARVVPPLQGRQGLLRLLLTLRAGHEPDGAGPTDLADAMLRARAGWRAPAAWSWSFPTSAARATGARRCCGC